jgi:hypothetical protein
MQFLNRVMFQLGKVSLEKYTQQNKFENSKFYCKNLQLDNIMYCTTETYNQIIDSNLEAPTNQCDLGVFIKKCYLQRAKLEGLASHEIVKPRLLLSEIHMWQNYDS